MERWSGKRLKKSAIYGVRVYRRGSMLHNHVDRSDTHIISAIVNVAQQVGAATCSLPLLALSRTHLTHISLALTHSWRTFAWSKALLAVVSCCQPFSFCPVAIWACDPNLRMAGCPVAIWACDPDLGLVGWRSLACF